MAWLNVLTDIATLCVPFPLVWRLQVDIAYKAQLIDVFLLGSYVVMSHRSFSIHQSSSSFSAKHLYYQRIASQKYWTSHFLIQDVRHPSSEASRR